MDATSSAYSAYLTECCPEVYETMMVEATGQSQKAKIKWGSEKRFGKTREDLEQQLVIFTPL